MAIFQQTRFNDQWVDYGKSAGNQDNKGGNLVVRKDLPFDVPTFETLKASDNLAGAHYFLPFPVALQSDQTKDVDTRLNDDGTPKDLTDYRLRWLPKGSIEGGTDNRVFGGLMRDYHELRRAKRVAVSSTTKTGLTLSWQIQDKMHETREAIKAGLTCFFLDILQVPQSATNNPQRWKQAIELFEAVGEVRRQDKVDFKIICMPDGTTSGTKNPTTLVDALVHLVDEYTDIVAMYDGKFLLAPYQPEGGADGIKLSGLTAFDFWDTVLKDLRTNNKIETFFWPCYQKQWDTTGQHPTLTSLSDGAGLWGDRDSVAVRSDSNTRARRAHYTLRTKFTTAQKWMHYATPGDQRPRENDSNTGGSRWWEQDHLETLIGSWEACIGDTTAKDANGELLHRKADIVQIPTWSDFPEHAHICPSHNHGRTLILVNWYFMIRYLTGSFPKIARDCLVLSHRQQPTDAEPNTVNSYPADTLQTKYMKAPTGSTTVKDTVSLTCFLTASARLYIRKGTTDHDLGTHNGFVHGLTVPLHPLGNGEISAYAVRNGSTVVNIPVRDDRKISTTIALTQDYSYKFRDNLSQPVTV